MSERERFFAVILAAENPSVAERIRDKYPKHYELSETVFLVTDDDIAETVAIAVGLKGDDRVDESSGVVFRLNRFYSGYAARSLWDWLAQAEGQ